MYSAGKTTAGEPTYFVEKILRSLDELNLLPAMIDENILFPEGFNESFYEQCAPKFHTIRAGKRWKAGDWFSPRIWSGEPFTPKCGSHYVPSHIRFGDQSRMTKKEAEEYLKLITNQLKKDRMNIKPETKNSHKELTALIKPLVDFMAANGFSYFIVAGKDGVCTRHMQGQYEDIEGMIGGLAEKNKQLAAMLKEITNQQPPVGEKEER